jgi:uncharacterized LabA/DUF88 family protein/cold shock CspA family protein
MNIELLRIGVFWDGQLIEHVKNYFRYEHNVKAWLSISGLQKYIVGLIANKYEKTENLCQIVESHYFRGRHHALEAEQRGILVRERHFDDFLARENISTHYWPLKQKSSGFFEEKGIDVWLALEAYDLAVQKKCDVIILVVNDGDYVPLVRKIQALGIQVFLLYWEFSYLALNNEERQTKVSRQLSLSAAHAISMCEMINDNKTVRELLFPKNAENAEPTTNNESTEAVESATPEDSPVAEEEAKADEYEDSIILSLHNGFGFIQNSDVGNVFFHYTSLYNCTFDALMEGDKVKYKKTLNAKKSGYMAEKVILVE